MSFVLTFVRMLFKAYHILIVKEFASYFLCFKNEFISLRKSLAIYRWGFCSVGQIEYNFVFYLKDYEINSRNKTNIFLMFSSIQAVARHVTHKHTAELCNDISNYLNNLCCSHLFISRMQTFRMILSTSYVCLTSNLLKYSIDLMCGCLPKDFVLQTLSMI